MGRKAFKTLVMTVFISILAVSLCGVTAEAAPKTFKWRFMTPLIRATNSVSVYLEMCRAITKRSGGRLKVDAFVYGEHPFKGSDMLGAVRDGQVEMANTEDVYISSVEPTLSLMMVPFLFKDVDQAKKVLKQVIPKVFEPLVEKKYKATIMTSYLICGEAVHAKKLLDSMDALKGQKIRVWGKETGDTISLLGGTPVTVAYGELYTAIQRGTIDGALTSMNGAAASKIHEVAKYVTWWDFAFPWEFTLVNKAAFDKLPPDLQKIVREECQRASATCQKMNEMDPPNELLSSMKKYGVIATALTPSILSQIQGKVKPVWDGWAKRAGATGAAALKIYHEVTKK